MAEYRGSHPDSQGTHQGPHGPGLRDRAGLIEQMSKSMEHIHLRFQAVVIASQLPDDRADALLVLDYARRMVVEFVDEASGGPDSVSGTTETQPLASPRVRGGISVQ